MEPTAADVMPKAIIRESRPGVTRKEQAAKAVGQKVVDKVKEGEWRKGIEETQRKKPIEQEAIDRKLDEIGVGRDSATGVRRRTAQEQGRFDRAEKSAKLAKKAIDQGFDKLDATSGGEQDKLRTVVSDAIKANPLLASEFNSLTTAQQKTEVERRLRDPKFMADLSEEMRVQLNPEKKLIGEDKIMEREDEVRDKGFKKTEAEDALNAIKTQVTNLDIALKDFDNVSVPPGKYASELKNLIVKEPTLRADLATYENDLEDLQTQSAQLARDRAALGNRPTDPAAQAAIPGKDAEIATKNAEIRSKKAEIDKNRKELNRITELQTEERSLREKKTTAENEKREKDTKFKQAELELSKSQRRLDDLKRERGYEEEDLAANLENVFAKTADRYINDELQAIEARVNAELEEMKKKTSDANERAMIEAIQKRWVKTEIKTGKKPKITISKEQTNKDWNEVVSTGGSTDLMKKLLMGQQNPSTGANYTVAEADALLADRGDSSFYKKMEPAVLTNLFQNKIMAGGLTPAEVTFVQRSSWGEGIVRSALNKNSEAAKELEELTGEKAINPGFMPKLWEKTKKHPWLLLTLLGIFALPIMAAKEGTSSLIK